MTATTLSGPSVVGGPLLGAATGTAPQDYSAEFGPSLEYNADGVLDLRYAMNKDSLVQNPAPAHLNNPMLLNVDAVPSAQVTLAAAQNVTSGTAMTLASTAVWGLALNIPILAIATNSVVTPAIMLDFGFSYLNVTAASTTATVANGTINWYQPGMWLVIGQATTTTTPLIAQVLAVTPTTATAGNGTITLSVAPGVTNATAPVGAANLGTVYQTGTATAHVPALIAGVGRFWDPQQSISRGLAVTGVASGAGGAFKVVGYDVYGNAMTETITATAGATTVYGNKAWKSIVSITPQFTDAHNYSITTSDVIGFMIKSDRYELTDLYYNGTYSTSSVSTTSAWIAADITNPATSTTKDTRGVFQVSTRGPNGTVTSTNYCNGTAANSIPGGAGYRVATYVTLSMYNLFTASPANPAPIYGVTPA